MSPLRRQNPREEPGALASEANRRLGELQTIRVGIIAGLTEWKNRNNSGMIDAVAHSLVSADISGGWRPRARSLAGKFGRLAPKAAKFGTSLRSVISQYPKSGS